MANRAYLYSADRLDPWEQPDDDYYDSRWIIPIAWFFFYRPADVCMADIRSERSTWQEVKLAADKDSAVELFMARQPLLLSLVAGRLGAGTVAAFADTVRGRPGRFLLLDPAEVLGGRSEEERWHAEQFSRILSVLQGEGIRPEAVLQAVGIYVGAFDPDPERFERQLLGYTYW